MVASVVLGQFDGVCPVDFNLSAAQFDFISVHYFTPAGITVHTVLDCNVVLLYRIVHISAVQTRNTVTTPPVQAVIWV